MSSEVKDKFIQNLFKNLLVLSTLIVMFLFKYYMLILLAILIVNLVLFAFQHPIGHYFPPLRKLYDVYPPENLFALLLKNCILSVLLIVLGSYNLFYGSDEKLITLVVALVLIVIFNIVSWLEFFFKM